MKVLLRANANQFSRIMEKAQSIGLKTMDELERFARYYEISNVKDLEIELTIAWLRQMQQQIRQGDM